MRKAPIKALVVASVLALGALAPAEAQGPYDNGGAPGPATAVGWNFVTLEGCAVTVNGYFFAYASGGAYAYTNNPLLTAAISPACQTGALIAVHVIRLVPFAWDVAFLYPAPR